MSTPLSPSEREALELDRGSRAAFAKRPEIDLSRLGGGLSWPGLPEDGGDAHSPAALVPAGLCLRKEDDDFTLLAVSDGFLALVGHTREELWERCQDRLAALIPPERRPAARPAQGDLVELEYPVRRGDGTELWVLERGRPSLLPDGTRVLSSVFLDITDRRRAREELRGCLARHQLVLNQTAGILLEWDIRRDRLTYSENWNLQFGAQPAGVRFSHWIRACPLIHSADMPALAKLMKDTAAGAPDARAEFRVQDAKGEFTWRRLRSVTLLDGAGRPVKAVGVVSDIDAEKKLYQRLLEQARRDGLTGLLNQAAARSSVEETLRRGGKGVLLLIDLDDFNAINDRHGHPAGDAVLSEAAAALRRLFRSSDIVARVGGDEFLAYLPGAPAEEARGKARVVARALASLSGRERTGPISCSVGASVFPRDERTYSGLLRCADLALCQVKSGKKGGFAFYAPGLTARGSGGSLSRSAVNAAIDSDPGPANELLGQHCFQMLYRSAEPAAAVNRVLEIAGRAYDVSRAYIYESSGEGPLCSKTFEWCGGGVALPSEGQQSPCGDEDLRDYGDLFGQNGVFYCGDVEELTPKLRTAVGGRAVRSLLRCAILDDGELRGFVGFDECREGRRWTSAQIETLTLVANILSTFLLNLRLKEQVRALKQRGAP